jgi:hypothetical protein
MRALKEVIRVISKVVGGIAVLVFFLAPLSDGGLIITAGSIIVGLICFLGYKWSESDDDPPSDSN